MITTEQLQRFCDVDNTRFYLAGPFRINGHIAATDGRICLAIPDDGRELPAPDGKLVTSILDVIKPCVGAFDKQFPDLEGAKQRERCRECDGIGYGEKPCSFCNGSCEHTCPDCGETHDCGRCDGTGSQIDRTKKCQWCDGQRTLPKDTRIDGHLFAGKYLSLMLSLPGVTYDAIDKDGCLRFASVAEGLYGAVMALHEGESNEVVL